MQRLLQRVGYDSQNNQVTLEFQPEEGMNGAAPLTFSLSPSQKPGLRVAARLPRLTRLLALAVKCEGLVRSGVIPDYAELAARKRRLTCRWSDSMRLFE